jgi:hypothetical protein
MTHKAMDEREDMKGKLIAQDKAMAQLKLEQQKAIDDLAFVEEQTSKVRKVIKNRSEIIENTLISEEMALPPSETLLKLNEVDKVDSPELKREEKLEQKPEKLVGSVKDFVQNGHSHVHASTLPVNPATGVPLLQQSTPVYAFQHVWHSSPYFCKYYVCAHMHSYMCMDTHVCVCFYHPLSYMQGIYVKVTSALQSVDHLCSGLVA